jgi:predicted negative regulator of RcsB-dependent stress response
MATYDLEEQEQIDEIKAWWKQYGNLLINAVTAVCLVVIAWQGWNWYQRSQSGQAAMAYNALQTAVRDKDSQQIKAASGELLEKFSRTSYASLGALSAAKAMVEAGDEKTAKLQLTWIVENGKDEVRDLGRLRLASLLLDEKAYDEALKQLDGAVSPGFEARFADARGDVFSQQGKKTEALAAYQDALNRLDAAKTGSNGTNTSQRAVYGELLQQKLDALGGSK